MKTLYALQILFKDELPLVIPEECVKIMYLSGLEKTLFKIYDVTEEYVLARNANIVLDSKVDEVVQKDLARKPVTPSKMLVEKEIVGVALDYGDGNVDIYYFKEIECTGDVDSPVAKVESKNFSCSITIAPED